jgi:hypothetical protein
MSFLTLESARYTSVISFTRLHGQIKLQYEYVTREIFRTSESLSSNVQTMKRELLPEFHHHWSVAA